MRNITIIKMALLILVAMLLFGADAQAQNRVSGYTSIDYDPYTNTVDAYSETDEDYDVNIGYTAYVTLYVYDQNGSVMGYDVGSDDGTFGYALAEVMFQGSPASTYTANGFHKAKATMWDYDYTYWPFVSIFYWDDFNFSSFENNQIVSPFYHSFLGPGPQVTRPSAPILLGMTTDADSVTTPGDDVLFNTAKIYQDGSGNFTNTGGRPEAHLTTTASNCNPYSNLTLTITYGPPEQTRDIRVTAKGFGSTSVSNWYVDPESINNNYNVNATPPTGTVSMLVNNKNGGHTGSPPYDSIQITVKGTYNSGASFSTLGAVHIQCP